MSTDKGGTTARALEALTRARLRIEALESARQRDPIAIVAMACRYPGSVEDPDAYWSLLTAGVDATGDIPGGRWDVDAFHDPAGARAGISRTRRGGFLSGDLDAFDADFFGISRREARAMDPQQRLLLEVAWEALERAGQPPRRAEGRPIGVYVGVATHDFADLVRPGTPRPGADFVGAFEMTGAATYAAAGRISYTLGLTGPSLVVETACSSSLVAVHLAVQALRNGECEAALAGGVNCILGPEGFVALSQANMLATDGRCKSFDAAADGMGRGEGCGLVLLQRLGDARRSGAPILGLILGSAVNQDGPSGGFTVPSGRAQRAVLRAAVEDARVRAADIDYVDAHGTGTPLGDPVELGALEAVFGEGRPADRPLLVGSAKANLAHLEGAAGIAGLMRAALAIERRVIPPHRMAGRRTERFDWAASHLELPGAARPWPSRGLGSSPLAGVSAFGAGGTNAHVILGAAPPVDAPAEAWTGWARPILPLSARDPQGLRSLAARWAAAATRSDIAAADLCVTAGRRALPAGVRVAVHGDDLGALRAGLEALAREPAVDAGPASAPRLALLFTGQGGVARGLGRNLFEQEPRFREVLQRCDAALGPVLPMSVTRWLCEPRDEVRPSQALVQPALFALEVALLEVWRAWGVEVGAAMGHSLGEYAAAYAAGMASLQELMVLVAERGRLMEAQAPGRMVALLAAPERVAEHLPATVSIAAVNGPARVVIAGAEAEVAAALRRLGEAIPGLQHRDLGVDRAFHSAHVDPILPGLRAAASRVGWRAPGLCLISNLTGDWAGEAMRQPAYWGRHARETVRFGAGLETLRAAGFTHFLEIGPGATLSGLAADPRAPGCAIASLGGGADLAGMHGALAALYAAGVDVDWPAIQRGLRGRQVPSLPTRPWQRVPLGRPVAPPARRAMATPIAPATHPLLGERLVLPDSRELRFATVVSPREPSFVAGHQVAGRTVFPAAGHVELALAALAEASPGRDAMAIADLIIERPLIFPDDGGDDARPLQIVVDPSGETRSVAIHVHEAGGWRLLCRAREAEVRTAGALQPWDADAEVVDGVRRVALDGFAARARAAGLEPGPAFGAIVALWVGEDRALGLLAPPAWITGPYRVPPMLFDAAVHVLAASLDVSREGEPPQGAWMQAGFARALVHGAPSARLWVRASVRARGDRTVRADLIVAADDGRAWLEIEGLQLRRAAVGEPADARPARPWHDWLYATRWRPDPAAGSGGLGVSPTALRDGAGRATEDWYDAPALAGYGRALAALDVLAAQYVHCALHALGWRPRPGEPIAADGLAAALDIVPAQHRAFAQLLHVFAAHGAGLGRDDAAAAARWIAASGIAPPPSLDMLRQSAADLRRTAPSIDAELTLLERCGEQLADILRGRTDPLALLFPDNDTTLATRIYTESPGSRTMNALARRAIVELLSRLPAERGLRVLEIGAGTGGTTASLLPLLDGGRVRYTFTDVGPVFLARARERFAAYDFVEYATLDIEADPCAQGFTAGDHDVVIAANVLHATRDLATTLTHVRRLLAPGGLLLLVEGSAPIAWIDLSFGLTAGWWRFTDVDTRGSYPLISGARWIERLRDHGFADANDLTRAPGIAHDPVLARSALIAAEADSVDPRATALRGHRWMVFFDDDPGHDGVRAQLEARGERCVVVRAGGAARRDERALGFDPADPENAGARLDGLLAGLEREGGIDRVLFAWAAGGDASVAVAVRRCAALLHLTQAILRARASRPIRLFVLTRAAQAVAAGEPVDVMMAPVWGLVRNVALEHPELGAHLVDIDREPASEPAVAALLTRAAERLPDEAVAVRGGRMYVMCLDRLPPPASERTFRLDETGWIVITGGQRGIGWEVARFLAGAGHRHLALLGRSEPEPTIAAEIDSLRRAGIEVRVLAADVANEAELAAALDALRRAGPPVRAVIHSAGVFRDHLLRDQRWSVFEQVLAPKVAGSWNLHRLTRRDPLAHFICFSSGSSLIGATGLSSYVTANAFVDALAAHRRALGLPALTINWGAWRDVGMAAAVGERREAQWHADGLAQMDPQQALDAFAHSVACDGPQLAIIALDRPRFLAQHRRGAVARFLEGLRAAPGGRAVAAIADPSVEKALAEAGSPAARRRLVEDHLERTLVELLGLPAGTHVDPRKGFFDMGLDSLMSVELRNRLQADLGRELPATLTFRFPTPAALLDFLCGEPRPEAATRAGDPAPAAGQTPHDAELDAIEALSADELEALINDNFDAVSRGRG